MNRAKKDSGIVWLGEIPEYWKTKKIKYIFRITKNIANETGHHVLSVTQKGLKIKDITSNEGQIAMDYSKYQFVNPGDFVMNHMDLLTGWVDCSKYNGVTSPDYRVFKFTNEFSSSSDYYKYIFQMCYSNKIFFGLGQGVSNLGRWRLQTDKFINFVLPVPSVDEQQKIANFLDQKVSQIDLIIQNTKLSIEEFIKYKQALITETITKGLIPNIEMRESGIEWIGKIPLLFKLGKIKYVTSKIGSGKTPKGGAEVYSDSGVLFLRSQNIYNTGLYLDEATFISEEIDKEMQNTRVYHNDVLLNITGGSIGRCCIYPLTMEKHANVNQHVCIIRTIKEKILSKFMFYFLNSNAGQSAINFYQTGANREGLNFEQIGNIKIPLPTIEEQHEIVTFLDYKCSHIDSLIEQKQIVIKELESYKKSLIYEYVTGKKEVL